MIGRVSPFLSFFSPIRTLGSDNKRTLFTVEKISDEIEPGPEA